jgi:glycine cleavage system H lipoate-binding protein
MAEAALAVLGTALIFLVGMIVRALLALAVLAVLILPMAAVLFGFVWLHRLFDRMTGLRRVGHVRWREGCYYTPDHLWIRPRGRETVRVGVDDLAQRVLPAIAAVRLSAAGQHVRQGEPVGEIRCVDGGFTLRAPVTGVIDTVNSRVVASPGLLHRDPYRRGWLIEMHPEASAYETLPAGERARTWLAAEDHRLTEFFEHQLGIAAADGGELVLPPHRLLTPAQWQSVRRDFLDHVA